MRLAEIRYPQPSAFERDDVIRRACISRTREQQASASRGHWWVASSPPRRARRGGRSNPSVSSSRFSAGRRFLISDWPPCCFCRSSSAGLSVLQHVHPSYDEQHLPRECRFVLPQFACGHLQQAI